MSDLILTSFDWVRVQTLSRARERCGLRCRPMVASAWSARQTRPWRLSAHAARRRASPLEWIRPCAAAHRVTYRAGEASESFFE
jgi:hypothetical protein